MKRIVSAVLVVMLILSAFMFSSISYIAASGTISYSFSNNKAGYAQGTITLNAPSGTYWLYWADDTKALDGYYKIAKLSISSSSASHTMFARTAIPADATKLIAFNSTSEPSSKTVASADAIYNIPSNKLLGYKSSQKNYSFGSYSDIHMDKISNTSARTYKYDDIHLTKAFNTAAARNVDFIVASGDYVNNNEDYPGVSFEEWKAYQRILANSDYCNPVYEAIGNHELWQSPKTGKTQFIKATGLEGNNSSSENAYFEKTLHGDHFIFMALEGGFYPDRTEEFSDEQLNWLDGLLKKYSGDGHNIYIIEHSLFYKYGAGDRVDGEPYYDIPLNYDSESGQESTRRFKTILETYKDAIFISGHTHISFADQYNYSDNNGTSAQMLHNSSVGGVRRIVNGSMNRDYKEDDTEGYIVDVYDNAIIFNGAALYYNMYDPNCCYIVSTSAEISGVTPATTSATTASSAPAVTTAPATTSVPATTSAASPTSTAIPTYNTTSYYLKGTFNSWKTSNPLYTTNDSNVLSTTLYLSATTYEFKIHESASNTWYGNDGTVEDTTKKTSNGGWEFVTPTNTPNCKLQASGGYYTFTFNKSNNKVNILYSTSDPYAAEPPETTSAPVTTAVPTTAAPITTAAPATTAEPTETSTEAVTYSLGDVNGDKTIDIADATIIQKEVAKLFTFSAERAVAADVSGDGKVTVLDATLIQKYLADIISEFPASSGKGSKLLSGASSISGIKTTLDRYYRYASYDSYQALKKEYFAQKNSSSPDLTKLNTLESALLGIVDSKNVDGATGINVTVYFEKPDDWGTPNAYVWGSSEQKAWPGNSMTYVGKNKYEKSIYSYSFDMGTYGSIIFNNGSNKTPDITLFDDNVAFYFNEKGKVYNYPFKSDYITHK